MKALITGIGGFVGRHLLAHLQAEGDEVVGLARSQDRVGLNHGLKIYEADLQDRAVVEKVIDDARPDAVYHLAAQASTSESLADPWGTISNNLSGQITLFEAMLASRVAGRVLVIGSADEYGAPSPEHIPTNEDAPLKPMTPYAVSKVGQDALAYQYFAQHRFPAIRVRPFSHTGPGHDPRFVVPSFARQVAEIEAGLREPTIRVGNLDVYRDFTDVRDIVRAYRLAVVAGVPGEVYNLGRGEAILLRDVLHDLVAQCRVPVKIEVDPALLRPSDVPRQQADITKFRSLTNWQPEIPWETTLKDTLDHWRVRTGAPSTVRS
jgi:GDP-4-dehydro-6-deoxy-D-mannose reductase